MSTSLISLPGAYQTVESDEIRHFQNNHFFFNIGWKKITPRVMLCGDL